MDTGAVRPFLQMALLSWEGAAWGEVSHGVPGQPGGRCHMECQEVFFLTAARTL